MKIVELPNGETFCLTEVAYERWVGVFPTLRKKPWRFDPKTGWVVEEKPMNSKDDIPITSWMDEKSRRVTKVYNYMRRKQMNFKDFKEQYDQLSHNKAEICAAIYREWHIKSSDYYCMTIVAQADPSEGVVLAIGDRTCGPGIVLRSRVAKTIAKIVEQFYAWRAGELESLPPSKEFDLTMGQDNQGS